MSKLPVDKQAKALIELYREAERRLLLMIERAMAGGALGTEANRRRQLRLIHNFLAEVQGQALPQAAQVMVEGYRHGLVIADGRFEGNFNSIHQDAVNVLTDNLVSRLNEATNTVGRKAQDLFRREALRESAISLIESGQRRRATEQLKETLLREGKTAFVDKAGRHWGLDQYAAMAIRTTTREATTQATLNRFVEKGRDLVSISEHAGSCPICKPLEGKTYSLSGSRGYERLVVFPPFHPNCRHVLLPAKQNLQDFEKAVAQATSLDQLEAALA